MYEPYVCPVSVISLDPVQQAGSSGQGNISGGRGLNFPVHVYTLLLHIETSAIGYQRRAEKRKRNGTVSVM